MCTPFRVFILYFFLTPGIELWSILFADFSLKPGTIGRRKFKSRVKNFFYLGSSTLPPRVLYFILLSLLIVSDQCLNFLLKNKDKGAY